MNAVMLVFIIVVTIVSLAGGGALLFFVFRRQKQMKRSMETDFNHTGPDSLVEKEALARGNFFSRHRNFILVAILLVFFSCGIYLTDQMVADCDTPARATVVGLDSKKVTKKNKSKSITSYTVYYADVSYEVNGETHVGRIHAYRSIWAVGDEVDIFYDPDRPKKCVTPEELEDTERGRSSASGILYRMFIFMPVFGAFLLIAFFSDRKRVRARLRKAVGLS